MTSCALCSIFACEPCNQTFPYPSKYIQYIAGRPHKLFVESLAIHTSTSTPNANEEFELPDSEICTGRQRMILTSTTKLKT